MEEKVGRNDPCPCGSGKKYKQCCQLKEGAKKTYDEAGKRKFKAKVVQLSGTAQGLFPTVTPSSPSPMQSLYLRFKMTDVDYRMPYAPFTAPFPIQFEPPFSNPEPAQEPLPLPDPYVMTQESYLI